MQVFISRIVAPSDGGLFIQRRTKQNNTNKKWAYANLLIPKQKKSKVPRRVGQSTNNRKKNSKISISNRFISQKDLKKFSVEEVSVNDKISYDIPPSNRQQNLSVSPKLASLEVSKLNLFQILQIDRNLWWLPLECIDQFWACISFLQTMKTKGLRKKYWPELD